MTATSPHVSEMEKKGKKKCSFGLTSEALQDANPPPLPGMDQRYRDALQVLEYEEKTGEFGSLGLQGHWLSGCCCGEVPRNGFSHGRSCRLRLDALQDLCSF